MPEIWTIQKILQWTTGYFQKHEVPEPRLSAELLLAHVLETTRLNLYLQFERILTPSQLNQYRAFVQRRVKYEPVQYITGEQDFMGLTFKVSPLVLIPRPETELLVENVLEDLPQSESPELSILDIGTGSGAIGISIARLRPDCRVTALDYHPEILELARENARRLGVENIRFRVQDIRHMGAGSEKYDRVVCNPPYISEKDFGQLHPQVKNFEPRQALLAGSSGLEFYQILVPILPTLLTERGSVWMEIGYDQKDLLQSLFTQFNFRQISFLPDYQNIYRIIKAIL